MAATAHGMSRSSSSGGRSAGLGSMQAQERLCVGRQLLEAGVALKGQRVGGRGGELERPPQQRLADHRAEAPHVERRRDGGGDRPEVARRGGGLRLGRHGAVGEDLAHALGGGAAHVDDGDDALFGVVEQLQGLEVGVHQALGGCWGFEG
jgi:hypothetical protein